MRFLKEKVSLFVFLIFILSLGLYGGTVRAYYGGLGSLTTTTGTTYFDTNLYSGLGGSYGGLYGLYGGGDYMA